MSTSIEPPQRELPRVNQGVFFGPAEKLPRGRHNLTQEEVQSIQTERILISMTELLAAHGVRGFMLADVARNAGVSLGALYDCFDSKEACLLTGYDRFIETLVIRMSAFDFEGLNRPDLICALIRVYAEVLMDDLVVARAYQVQIDTLGAVARTRRHDSLMLLAKYAQDRAADIPSSGDRPDGPPWVAYIGVVYAVRQFASDALDAEPNPDLLALIDEISVWVADVFR